MPQTTQNKKNRIWTNQGGIWKKPLPIYRHGDSITINNLITASNNSERAFSGGLAGFVESLNVGDTIPNANGWLFDTAAHNPKVFNDSTRGKVMYNDYNNQTDLDASKTYTFSTPIAPNTDFYVFRYVRAEILTTGGVVFPNDKQIQWKLGRMNYSNGISDDGDTNTGQELFSAIFYNSNGRQVRTENNAGLTAGTLTSGSTTTIMNDSTASWIVNSMRNRRIDINNAGSHQYGVVASNTATSFTLINAITAPPAGATYSIATQQDYFGLSGLVPTPNSGWFIQEQFIHTSTQGISDGSYTIRYRQGGVIIDDIKTNIPIYGGTKRFIYPFAQDYFGNGEVAITSKKSFTDDMFQMSGTNTRLVLSNSLNIDTAITYEIQNHDTWSSNSATLHLNGGGAPTGQPYYLCEVSGVNTILSSIQFSLGA